MQYICSHCRHTGTGWLTTGDSAVCPECFRFTLKANAVVREPVPTKEVDLPPGFEVLFGRLHR